MKYILVAMLIIGMANAGGDPGAANAAMSAAAGQLGSMGASTIGGYGGSSSGSSSGGSHSAISAEVNANIEAMLASGQTSDGSVTGNLQSLISGGSLPSTTPPSASVSENMQAILGMPDASSSLGRGAAISSTHAGFAAISGGSTSGFSTGISSCGMTAVTSTTSYGGMTVITSNLV